MNMFARFDENPAMTLQDIKKKKNVTDGWMHGRTHGLCENSIPTTNKVCGGYKNSYMNMFARFDENPAMTLQDIKKTKRYGRMHARRARGSIWR